MTEKKWSEEDLKQVLKIYQETRENLEKITKEHGWDYYRSYWGSARIKSYVDDYINELKNFADKMMVYYDKYGENPLYLIEGSSLPTRKELSPYMNSLDEYLGYTDLPSSYKKPGQENYWSIIDVAINDRLRHKAPEAPPAPLLKIMTAGGSLAIPKLE